MKLLVHANRIVGSAGDEYTGPDAYVAAPPDFDPQQNYVLVDGVPTIDPPAQNVSITFDAPQSLSVPQQLQACQNIGIGDPEVDLLGVYAVAKA